MKTFVPRSDHRVTRGQRIGNLCLVLGFILSLTLPVIVDAYSKTLIIALDAIPYEVINQAMERDPELFRGFHKPTALISTFPSFTTVAFTGILNSFGLQKAPGYEARFFSIEENRIMGGGPISYYKVPFSWRGIWDWHLTNMAMKGYVYIDPKDMAEYEIEKALSAFQESSEAGFLVYILSTDAVGHFFGAEKLELVLRSLNERLQRLLDRYPPGELRIVMFSDHGMTDEGRLTNLRDVVIDELKSAGLTVSDRLRSRSDVVLVPFGLISSGAFYCNPSVSEGLSAALLKIKGVDLVMQRSDRDWIIMNRTRGAALISERMTTDGRHVYCYEPITGDPLLYQPVLERLLNIETPVIDDDKEWFTGEAWFEETWNEYYPNALFRILDSDRLVANGASVLISCEPGFVLGAVFTKVGAKFSAGKFRGSHGALWRQPSLGFITSNDEQWRAAEALSYHNALCTFRALDSRQSCD